MNVAVMGYGTVGSGVVEIINKRDLGLDVKYILDLRDFPGDENASKFTKDFNDILTDDTVKIVVETMGGQTPAFDFVSKCLAAGKHVVTSNKELVAEKGLELITLAKENNVNFMFEASVGGGIPIIRPLTFCLKANKIRSVNGILNGTTNFILTKMIRENMSFADALKIAQDNGYAEKDPTADVEGHDACRKICILSALAFGNHVYPKNVHCEGITKIALEDVATVAKIGASIKLIGTAEDRGNGQLYIVVSPAIVMADSQLNSVSDVFNAVLVNGDATDEVLFFGKGAGKLPTASAVVADALDCMEHDVTRRPIFWGPEKPELIMDYKEIPNKYYIRLSGASKEAINAAFAGADFLDAASSDDIAFISSEITENEARAKISAISGAELCSLIRVARC